MSLLHPWQSCSKPTILRLTPETTGLTDSFSNSIGLIPTPVLCEIASSITFRHVWRASNWTDADADAVSEASLRAYEEDLKTRWKLQVRRQSQRQPPSTVAQGQERLTETLSEDSVLDGQVMPKAITCGSFHALAGFDAANEPEIGWHPEFEKLAKGTRGKS